MNPINRLSLVRFRALAVLLAGLALIFAARPALAGPFDAAASPESRIQGQADSPHYPPQPPFLSQNWERKGGERGEGEGLLSPAALSGTKTICPSGGDYATLTAAIADIQSQGLDGPLTLELCSTYTSGSETFPLTFPAFPGSSATNTVTVRPAADAAGLTITSSAAQTIELHDATYVIFDGRPGGVGSSQELTIENNGGGKAMFFWSGWSGSGHNTLQYLTIKSVGDSVVYFSGNYNEDNTIDHCDVSGSTKTTCKLINVAWSQWSSGNTLSNNRLHRFYCNGDSAGVYLDSPGGWTITGNSFYQDVPLETVPKGLRQYGIKIVSGEGYVIADNVIGGSQPDGGGAAWTYSKDDDNLCFYGIYLNVGMTTASTVQGNTIANFVVSSNSMTVWSGIYALGAVNIVSNTIGSGVGTGSVQVTSFLDYGEPTSYGIYSWSFSDVTIADNTIGSITVAGATTDFSHSFVGIYTCGLRANTITGNTVGSLTTADSIQAATASTSHVVQYVRGIESASSGDTSITGNTVANLSNAYAGTAAGGQTVGIRTMDGANTITGNIVRNLTSASATTAVDHDAALVGIAQAATAAGNQTVAQNVVHSLASTAASADVYVYGIYFRAPEAATNLVSRNSIHSLSLATSGSGVIIGIDAGGTATYQNNVVRLGVDAAGAAIAGNYAIYGIWQSMAASFYFNTVYIGGGPVASGVNDTYAFQGASNTLVLQNNLLVNARANGGGTGKHGAAFFATTTGLTSDYNVFLASGAGGVPIRHRTTDYTLNTWQSASGQDNHSIAPAALGQVNLVNPMGDAASVDLRVQSPTVAEGAGVDIPAISDDYAGQTRSDLSPVDIGAYAGNWTAIALPAFAYTPLPATTASLTGPTLSNVAISAAAGVNIAPGTRPRLYYKRATDADTVNDNTSATDGWKWVEATGTGGSPFEFTLDYSLLYGGGVSWGETIQYFVVAQTLAATPAVGISGGTLAVAPASVALTAAAFPMGGLIESYRIIQGLSGVKAICSDGDYTTLTAAIADIEAQALSGPLTLELCAGYTSGGETFPLTFPAFTGSSATNTVTVRPAADAAGLTITSDAAQTIYLYPATYVIFDGRPGGSGSAQELTIENTSASGYAVRFAGSAHNTLQYLTIKGVGKSVVYFSGLNDDNTIDHCDMSGSTMTTAYLVQSQSTNGSGNTLSNNRFHRFCSNSWSESAGVYLGFGNAGWTITGNSFYQDAPLSPSAGSRQYGIEIVSGEGYVIADNVIGGSQADGGGAAWTYAGFGGDTRFYGIYLDVGAKTASSVQGNTIANFAVSSGSTAPWQGIYVGSGAVNIVGNTIGSGTGTGSVQVTTGGVSANSYGIYSVSANGVTVANNVIGSITVYAQSHSFYGIYVDGGANTISGNTIGSATTANSIQAATASTSDTDQSVYGIRVGYSATATNVTSNTVANLTNAYAGSGSGQQIVGIRTNSGLNTITGNTVRNLTTASANTRSGESGAVIGISLLATTAGQTVARNVVHSLADTAASGAIQVTGIYYYGPTSGDNVVARNLVHSLSLATSGAGVIRGIYADGGVTTYQNNLVRLGVDASGAAITGNYAIYGIHEEMYDPSSLSERREQQT